MFFPALDAVVIDLRVRFGEEQKRAAKLGMLIPANMTSDWEKDFKPLQQDVLDTNLYLALLTEPIATVKAEYKLWHLQWSNVEEKPQTSLTALNACSPSFPAISSLLQIMATLPCITAQAEQIFSKTERMLTAIRSSMNEDRVESLVVLLQVHPNNTPSADEVVIKFAACHARRVRLIL